jgi:hypothetical protein
MGVWERLRDYQAIAYFLLTGKSTGKMRDYPDALLIWHLQLAWMTRVNHPALSVVAEDPALANEEGGEISLSEFSKGVKAGSCAPDAESMSSEYRMQGASREVVHDMQENLDISQEANYHEVTAKINAREVDHAEATLKQLRKCLHTDARKSYDFFEIEAAVSSTGKKTSKKVPFNAVPQVRKELTPFFEQPAQDEVWDVAGDFETVKKRYFNQPPRTAFVRRDSESDSEDSDPLAPPRPLAPVQTRGMTRPAAGAPAAPGHP